jgi:tetraacyldisaccharide 4'-kinase
MPAASSIILAPFVPLYGAITVAHRALYKRGLLRTTELPTPVISIGNITAGGTGKTPLVEFIARHAAALGRQTCILTRGYGRKDPNTRVLVSDGNQLLAQAVAAGDEPVMLATNLKGIAAVISDANRVAAAKWAHENLKTEIFILDDGFQHFRIARDLNIVTIDATNPWGDGHLLPRGLLREHPRNLERSDCIVITRADQANNIAELKHAIDGFSGGRPLFTSRMKVGGWRRGTADGEFTSKPTQPVGVFCGIANASSFLRELKNESIDPVFFSEFPDHHRYTQIDLDQIVISANRTGARALVTTAKDAVKLKNLKLELPCYVMDIEIQIDDVAEFLKLIQTAVDVKKR